MHIIIVLMHIDPAVRQTIVDAFVGDLPVTADEWQYHPRFGKPAYYLYAGGVPNACVEQVQCGPFVAWRRVEKWPRPNGLFATAEEAMRAIDEERSEWNSRQVDVPKIPRQIIDAVVRVLEGR